MLYPTTKVRVTTVAKTIRMSRRRQVLCRFVAAAAPGVIRRTTLSGSTFGGRLPISSVFAGQLAHDCRRLICVASVTAIFDATLASMYKRSLRSFRMYHKT